jgi:prepilin-type N-terminal cleavage/methylation domain-containing protein
MKDNPPAGSPLRLLRKQKPRLWRSGFTLLEVLVAVALLGIAITVVLQLFSANLQALSSSEDYVAAATRANIKLREVVDEEEITESSWTEVSEEGYTMDVSITNALEDRTEKLQVALFEIALTVRWSKGARQRSLTLRTLKALPRQI